MLALAMAGCSVFGAETHDDLNVLGDRILARVFDREVVDYPAAAAFRGFSSLRYSTSA